MAKPIININQITDFIGNIPNNAELSINQPDTSGKLGWRTVKVNMEQLYQFNKSFFNTVNFIDGLNVSYEDGLTGLGTTTDPLRVSREFFDRWYTPLEAINVSQIGNVFDYTVQSDGKFKFNSFIRYGSTNGVSDIFKYRFTKDVNILLAGIQFSYTTDTSDVTITTETLDPNKPVYFYFEVKNRELKWFISTDKLPESYTLTCAGIWAINKTLADSRGPQVFPYTRIGNYRLNQNQGGSSIPVSVGFPFNTEYTLWE